MATRTVSTRVAIEGEDEFQAKIRGINNELQTLRSELKMVQSEFQDNASSIEALTAANEALGRIQQAQVEKLREAINGYVNAKDAVEQYSKTKEQLTEQIRKNEEELERLKKSSGDTTEAQKKLSEENAELNKKLEENEAKLSAAERGLESWQKKVYDAQTELNNTSHSIEENNRLLDEERTKTGEGAESWDRFGDEGKEALSELAAALTAAGVKKTLDEIVEVLEECIDSFTRFESAMAGVKRTVGGSDEFIGALGERFKELSTVIPITTEEIGHIAEIAGQLGIKQENVERFTTTMARLGTATDLTAESAATLLAQFSNILGIDAYEQLGSTVAALGDSSATTASKITEMANGMAAAGAVAGLNAPEILGIATALGSVGVRAMAGSTAMNTLLLNIDKAVAKGGDALDNYARVAGLSASRFREAWETNTAAAFTALIEGITNVERNGKEASLVLEDLGITNARQVRAVLSLANGQFDLATAIGMANDAWEENTALEEKAAIMYSTTEAKTTMFKNAIDNLKIAIGEQLAPALKTMIDLGTDAAKWAENFVKENDAIVPIIGGLTAALGALATAIGVAAIAASGLGTALAKAGAAVLSNPIMLAVTAVAALGTAFLITETQAKQAIDEMSEAATTMQETIESTGKSFEDTQKTTEATVAVADRYITKLEELEAAGLDTEEAQREYHDTLALLCELVPDLAQYIDLETDSIDGGTEALRKNTEAWAENTKQQAYQERVTEITKKYADVLLEAEMNQLRLRDAETELAEAQSAHSEAQARQNELWEEARTKAEELTAQTGVYHDALEFTSEEYRSLESSMTAYADAVGDAQKKVDDINGAIEKDAEAVAAADEEIGMMTEAVENLTTAEENAVEPIENVTSALGDLAAKYLENKDAAAQAIEKHGDLAETFDLAADGAATAEQAAYNLQLREENLTKATENIRKAAIYGLDEGLVASLVAAGYDGAVQLNAIIESLDDAGASTEGLSDKAAEMVENLNANFESSQQAYKNYETLMGAFATSTSDAVEQIRQAGADLDLSEMVQAVETYFLTATEKATEGGENVSEGIATGITNKEQDAIDAIHGVAEKMDADFTKFNGIASPAKLYAEHGGNIDAGLAKGITDNTVNVLSAMTAMLTRLTRRTEQQLQELKRRMVEIISTLPGAFETVGAQTGQGFIDGFYSKSGSLYYAVENVVDTAITRARRAAATASPSKKTIKIGEDIGEGFVVGITEKGPELAAAAQKIIDAAMKIDAQKASASLTGAFNAALAARTKAGSTGYDAGVDYSALMEKAGTLDEFMEAAAQRQAKIVGENIDLVANGWKTSEQFLEEWLQKNELSVAEAGALLTRYTAEMKKAMKDVSEDVKYTADTDYSALMQEAESLSAFLDLAAQRTAKVVGENIDLAANGWKTNAEFLDEWLRKSGASVQGLSEDILKYADVFRAAAYETSDALEYAADTDYHALMLQADSFEEFVRLASLRNAKIVGQGIDLLAEGWKSNSEILEEWLKKSELAIESTDKKTKDADKGLGEVLGEVEDLTKEIDRLIGGLPRQFTNIGEQMIKGMITGLHRYEDGLYFKIQQIVEKAIATARDAAGVASPSRKMKEIFQYMGDGAILGLKNREEAVANEMEHLMSRALGAASGSVGLPEIGLINDRMPRLPEYSEGYGGIAAAIENAFAGVRPAGGDSNITFTLEIPLDGQTLARKTYTYFRREGSRLGGNLVEVAG